MIVSAEQAIEEACARAEDWFRTLPVFPARPVLGSVVGFRHPAILSEQDCVMHFSRFLHEAGVAWDAMHHEVSMSRWLFDKPHPAAMAGGPAWRVDLAVLISAELAAASLPATQPGFRFDACVEFAYLEDSFTLPGAVAWGAPTKFRDKVQGDVEKVGRYITRQICQTGYVVVFEEADCGFQPDFAESAEAKHGCRVRFVRGYSA